MEIIFVVGKGGVGKTTLTAALSLKDPRRSLTYSLDPLPNLCEVIGIDCSNGIVEVGGKFFGEIDYDRVKEKWMERFGEEAKEALMDALGIDEEMAEELARHASSSPGVPEQFTLLFILEEAERRGVEVVYFDTPPLGPIIKMLKAEREFYEHLLNSTKVYRKLFGRLGIKGTRALTVIERWRDLAEFVLERISNAKYVLVSTPERFPRTIALKGAEELEELGMRHLSSYVNKADKEVECLKPPTYAIPNLGKEPVGKEALLSMLERAKRVC